MEYASKVKASLLAGALGDALGYSVEFMWMDEIQYKYGKKGICEMQLHEDKYAWISDDTQMTLFTAEGILKKPEDPVLSIYCAYLDWLTTQLYEYNGEEVTDSSLVNDARFFARRAPGTTCISALSSMKMGTIENPLNKSKGCGGVMRIAPIALYYAKEKMPVHKIAMMGVEASAITHGSEMSHISAYFLTSVLVKLMRPNMDGIENRVIASLRNTCANYAGSEFIYEFRDLINRALSLAKSDVKDVEAIHSLGGGWVAEEAVAIAIYAFLKYKEDVKKALICAVNHNGDSDSTGAICGNLIGAYLGEEALPKDLLSSLELKDVIIELSEKLAK